MQTTLFVGGICHSHVTTKLWVTRQTTYPLLQSSSPIQATIQHSHVVKIVIVTLHTVTFLCSSQWVHLTTCKTAQTKCMLSSRHCFDHSSGSPHFWGVVDFWQCGSAIVTEFHWLVQAPNERSNPPLAARGLECARFESKTVKLKAFARSLLVRCDSREITVPTVLLPHSPNLLGDDGWESMGDVSKSFQGKASHSQRPRDPSTVHAKCVK